MARFVKLIAIAGVLIMGLSSLVGCVSGNKSGELAPDAGTYAIEPARRIAGAERHVRLSHDGVVSYISAVRRDPLEGDGMADSLDVYTFTAMAPGEVDVQVYDILPWVEGEQVEATFRLVVDDNLAITRVDAPSVERFELREQDSMAGWRVYEAAPGDASMLLVSIYWEDFDGNRSDERALSVPPGEIAGTFIDCNVASWNGFHESNPHVLDGYSFSFEASLSDGTTISASGSNASPKGYAEFKAAIGRLLGE